MSTLRNSVQLIGRLGADPEKTTYGENKSRVRFSLATNDYFRDKDGERQEETQWHNIVAFGKTAEIAEKYLKKGDEVALGGKITYRSWDDKEGNKHYITEVILSDLLLLGDKK